MTRMNHFVAATVTALILGVSTSVAQAEGESCGKPMTDAQVARRTLDMMEIQNVAGLHEYYHNALMHCEELANAWATKAKDITWTNNTDKYSNRESVYKFYCDGVPKGAARKGALWYHMLTTPVIEVAGDGKTAKGIWMSFGNVSGAMGGEKGQSQWTQEKYGMDFIKEDGHWRIWHLRTYVDFYVPTDKSWIDPMANMASGVAPPPGGGAPPPPPPGGKKEAGVKEEPGVSFAMAAPDEKGTFYPGYTLERDPALAPTLPKPYCHFSEVQPY